MHRDLALGSITLALAAAYYAIATSIPQSLLADEVGPERLPKTYAVVLAVLSLILIVRSLARRPGPALWTRLTRRVYKTRPALQEEPVPEEPRVERRALWRVAGMLMIGVVYVAVVPWIGYVLSLAGVIMATTYYQGGTINRRVVLVAASGAVFFWLLFVLILGIPQPSGFWPSLL